MKVDDILQQILHWFEVQSRDQLFWAAGILLAAYLLRKPLAKLSLAIGAWVVKGLGATLKDEARTALMPATMMIYTSIGWLIALSLLVLPDSLADVLERIVFSVMVAAVFSALYELIVPLGKTLDTGKIQGAENLGGDWVLKAAQVVVVVLAIASVLEIWGIEIASAMTGLGVFGAALALAAQDFVRNMLSGMSNMSEGRFKLGDLIQLENGEMGAVERIELRSTLIRKADQSMAFIPNGDLANGQIVNFTTRDHRRIYWTAPLRSDTTSAQVTAIRDGILVFIDDSDDFLNSQDFPARIRVSTVNNDGIMLFIYVFTQTNDYTEFLGVQEDLVLKVVDLVQTSGAHFSRPMILPSDRSSA